MNIITKRTLLQSITANWLRQYPLNGKDPEKEEIYHKLAALSPTATAEDVNKIIGNDSWTTLARCCTECKETGINVVEFYSENEAVVICQKCLEKAIISIKEKT